MLNTNRKLIVGSEKLFIHNSLLNQFATDHDIFTFSYDPKMSRKANTKKLFKNLLKYLKNEYDKIVFIGLESDCNILYELYTDKQLKFDTAIFVNYRQIKGEEIDLRTEQIVHEQTPIYSFTTKKNDPCHSLAYLTDHQYVKTLLRTTRSNRLAQEIFGTVVYGLYSENYLEGTPTKFIG